VAIGQNYFRPAEVDLLIGDCSKAKEELGWQPKTTFRELAKLMVDADIQMVADHLAGRGRVAS
jgi:GDPmannose 4,6-dehydratase